MRRCGRRVPMTLFCSAGLSAQQHRPAGAAACCRPAARRSARRSRQGRGRGGGFRQPDPIDFEEHDGWTSLFDGKTLNGWSGDQNWKVEDGAITIESTCEKPTGTVYLVWKGGEAADFELKIEMKGTGSINGGVQYRGWIAPRPQRGGGPGRAGGAPAAAGGAAPAGAAAAPAAHRARCTGWRSGRAGCGWRSGSRRPRQSGAMPERCAARHAARRSIRRAVEHVGPAVRLRRRQPLHRASSTSSPPAAASSRGRARSCGPRRARTRASSPRSASPP